MNARQSFRRAVVFSQGGLLLVTLLLYAFFRRGQFVTDFWDGEQNLGFLLYVGLMCGLGIRIITTVLSEAWPKFQQNMNHTVIRALEGIGGLDLLLISLPPAVVEELFFRGFLQPYVGVWIGAAIFSVLHWGFVKELWAHGLHAFLIGLFLGWLYIETGSLIAPMMAHFVNNLMAGLYIQKRSIF